ncbi:MAG: glycosyl transferase [Paludibacter sp.]|nr:MAG: glycosyl transferase [Paludibacter sp.]
MLSILIPTYNYDIRELVKELHTQGINSYKAFEIIVMEDGSTKCLRKNGEVKELKFCQYIQLSENIGRSAIRNRLAEKAKYNHLIFIDCDAEVQNRNFIEKYLSFCDEECVVIGGTAYDENNHNPKMSLRLKYGREKEGKSALERNKNEGYSHFSTFNFLISKNIFNNIKFDETIKGYGHEDTLFGHCIKELNTKIYHIENPLIHKGLDENTIFIKKTEKATENLYKLYETGKYPFLRKQSKLLTTFEKIKRLKLTSLFKLCYQLFSPLMKKNLCRKNPSLLLFDIYKLLYLCKVAREE